MAIVRHTRVAGASLTPEQLEEIEAASRRPYVYDPDCPLLTEAQLAEFRPVNGMTWEERERLMRERGIVDPEAWEPAVQEDAVRVPAMV
jgi:hypothetical protein